MNKTTLGFVIILFAAVTAVSARSVWENYALFDRTFRPGDALKIVFSEKTMIRYESQIKQNDNRTQSGVTPHGELFDFFPSAGAAQNDQSSHANTTTVKVEDKFAITAAVVAVTNNLLRLRAHNTSVIGGEMFDMNIDASCDARSVGSDRTVNSVDLYDMSFSVHAVSATNLNLTMDDLIFKTNYHDIRTNRIVDAAGVTNVTVTTNMSSMKYEVTGIRDEAKQRLILRYLNLITGALFQ